MIAYYSWSSTLLADDVDRYVQLIEDAGAQLFNTRFQAFWNGNYVNWEKTGKIEDLELEMIPNNYEELKQDQAFLYFLRSLKNHFYWKMEVSQRSINQQASEIIQNIDAELKT